MISLFIRLRTRRCPALSLSQSVVWRTPRLSGRWPSIPPELCSLSDLTPRPWGSVPSQMFPISGKNSSFWETYTCKWWYCVGFTGKQCKDLKYYLNLSWIPISVKRDVFNIVRVMRRLRHRPCTLSTSTTRAPSTVWPGAPWGIYWPPAPTTRPSRCSSTTWTWMHKVNWAYRIDCEGSKLGMGILLFTNSSCRKTYKSIIMYG